MIFAKILESLQLDKNLLTCILNDINVQYTAQHNKKVTNCIIHKQIQNAKLQSAALSVATYHTGLAGSYFTIFVTIWFSVQNMTYTADITSCATEMTISLKCGHFTLQ